MSQASEDKALAYLAEGRVKVQHHDAESGWARIHVQGSAPMPYLVTYQAGVWTCDCPARKPLCAHVIAAHFVSELRDRDSGLLGQNLDPEVTSILEAATRTEGPSAPSLGDLIG